MKRVKTVVTAIVTTRRVGGLWKNVRGVVDMFDCVLVD